MKRTILLLVPATSPAVGGGESLALALITELANSHTLCVVSPRPLDVRLADHVLRHDGKVVIADAKIQRGVSQAPWEAGLFGLPHQLHDLLEATHYDLVWALSHESAIAAAIALADNPTIPLVTTYSEIATEYFPFGRARAAFAYSLQRVDLHVTLSETYQDVALAHGAIPERVMLNPLGFSVSGMREGNPDKGRARLGASVRQNVVFCPSRLSERKGQLVLLDAWEHLGRTGELLVLAGAGHSAETSYGEKVEARILAWKGSAGVKLIAEGVPRVEMPDCLAASSVLVQPSFYEGLGYSALEGMAAGIPCVLTDVDGFRTFMQDGSNCVGCEPKDEVTLGAALRRALDDARLRQAVIVGGLATSAGFSIELNSRRVLERVNVIPARKRSEQMSD